MSSRTHLSSGARTQFLEAKGGERYAYRRFGSGPGLPLLLLQHFTGTLDNWDPAVTDALAAERELILFDNAGIGRSSGTVPTTVAGMAQHVARFSRRPRREDVRRARILARRHGRPADGARPSPIFRRMILVGTAPRGGEDIMHLEKPRLATHLQDPLEQGVRRPAEDLLHADAERPGGRSRVR